MHALSCAVPSIEHNEEVTEAVQAYEVMILIDPEVEEARQEEIIARVRDIVLGAGGTWDAVDPWGRRKLAYEIDKKGEAYYWMVRTDLSARTPWPSSSVSSGSRTRSCGTRP